MASISLRDITLNQTAITGKRKTVVQIVNAKVRRKMDLTTNQMTDEIENCIVDILALKGQAQSVKLDAKFATTISQIADAIQAGKIVTANFGEVSTLRGKPYALNSNGRLISGISCTATDFNVVAITDDVDDIDLDEIDLT